MSEQATTSSKTNSDRGDAKPSSPHGDNPATAGRGETKVTSNTPEGANGAINPSAPGETGTSEKTDR